MIVIIAVSTVSMFVYIQHLYALFSFIATYIVLLVVNGLKGEETKADPLALMVVLGGLAVYYYANFEQERRRRSDFLNLHIALRDERRTQQFLDTMLPSQVTMEMMTCRADYIAHVRDNASVLFCDIVSFTAMCSQLDAIDVVALLNVIFSIFDELSTTHKVYKVETIGDCYYACSGVIYVNDQQTKNMVNMALDFQTHTCHLYSTQNDRIMLRIGVHTGSVLAGVVGKKMPRYHLFGETVSLAEEMEQGGIPGAVVVSEETYKSMHKEGTCEEYIFESLNPLVVLDTPHGRYKVTAHSTPTKVVA